MLTKLENLMKNLNFPELNRRLINYKEKKKNNNPDKGLMILKILRLMLKKKE